MTPATRALVRSPLLACALLTLPAAPALAGNDFVTVAAAQCQAVDATVALPADMEPYRSAVRVCSLARPAQPVKVRLVSVFTDDYYKHLPADAPWQRFPLPVLLDDTGRCLGRIPHLFPVDPPQELVVRAGQWRRGIPHELRLTVLSPAVGGNYRLPSLRWNPKAQTYQSTPTPTSTPTPSEDKTPCP